MSFVFSYMQEAKTGAKEIAPALLAYLVNLENVARVAPGIARAIVQEFKDQRNNLKLIASENYSSVASQCAMANLLTDKYAEGVANARYYAGCDNVDTIERDAAALACELFKPPPGQESGRSEHAAQHAYVQPHSGADANLVAYLAILRAKVEIALVEKALGKKEEELDWRDLSEEQWEKIRHVLGEQKLLALDYYSGGHLTHGYRLNISARMFQVSTYKVSKTTGLLDYDDIETIAKRERPLILLAGFSAYPRSIDYRRMRAIADGVGAVLMVDMAHFAGLVAGGVLQGDFNPIAFADIVTSTTHKTLRGPRGGLVLCTASMAKYVDKGCPMVLGGPLPHVMAAKAVSFTEALRPEFKQYARQIVTNAQALAAGLEKGGGTVLTHGTENHIVLFDVRPLGLTGYQAEAVLRKCGITLNRNSIPYDPEKPKICSGLRFGTPAVTTLGMGAGEMEEIASIIIDVLRHTKAGKTKTGDRSKMAYVLDDGVEQSAQQRVHALLGRFPLYKEIDLPLVEGLLKRYFA